MGFVRKYLSADGLCRTVRNCIKRANLPAYDSEYSWQDCLMSGLAIFGFKSPSLLQFEQLKYRLRRKPRYDQMASCQKIYSELRRLFNRPRAPCVRFATTNGFSQHMIYPAGSCG
jgi:hypothetical protein